MSIRSVCMVLVISAVFTIPAFGQTQQNCPLGDVNCFFNLSTPSAPVYDYQGQTAEEYYLDKELERLERKRGENPYQDSTNECGFFWQGNKQAMDECIQRHQ